MGLGLQREIIKYSFITNDNYQYIKSMTFIYYMPLQLWKHKNIKI